MRAGTIAAAGLAISMIGTIARAQDRMPPIPAERMTDAQTRAVDAFRAARSAELTGPFIPMLRSPELLIRAQALGEYLRYRSALPPRLSEFLILVTARQWSQSYEWGVHEPIARRAGVDPATIDAIAQGRRPDRLTEDEGALYALADELARNHSVSDATFAAAVARVGEQGVVDALGIAGYYTMLAMILNTARTPAGAGALAPFPR